VKIVVVIHELPDIPMPQDSLHAGHFGFQPLQLTGGYFRCSHFHVHAFQVFACFENFGNQGLPMGNEDAFSVDDIEEADHGKVLESFANGTDAYGKFFGDICRGWQLVCGLELSLKDRIENELVNSVSRFLVVHFSSNAASVSQV